MSLDPGTTVGAYVVESLLGQGGMATVYRVRHKENGGTFALKVLSYNDDSLKERLVNEGKLQAALRHPNILPVVDTVRYAGQPGIVLDYIDGRLNLEMVVQRGGLTVPQVDALARGLLAGLGSAHAKGIIHRDLKPANVLLACGHSGEPIPKICDFGLSKALGGPASSTRTGTAMGSPKYMAPEQLRDAKSVDHRADLWSIGAMLYEMLSGTPVITGGTLLDAAVQLTSGKIVPLRQIKPEVPARMADAIDRCLQIDPERRIASCEELLVVWTGGEPPPAGAALWRGFWGDKKPRPYGTPPAPVTQNMQVIRPNEATVWEQEGQAVPVPAPQAPAPTPARPAPAKGGVPVAAIALVVAGVLLLGVAAVGAVALIALGIAANAG